jgi:hypothetical protein
LLNYRLGPISESTCMVNPLAVVALLAADKAREPRWIV